MARFLAVDWDHSEVRYLYGTFSGDQLILLKSGSAPLTEPEEPRSADDAEPVPEGDEPQADDEADEPPEPPKGGRGAKPATGKDAASVRRGQILKELLRRDSVPAAPMLICLPRDRAELLNLSLPRLAETELPDIVKNQVLRDGVAYIEGHPLDFIPLAADGEGGTGKVFSASISRIELRNLRTFASAAGRKPAKIELRLTAPAEFVRSDRLTRDGEYLLVQEGIDELNFALFRNREPVYFRTVQVDAALDETQRQSRLAAEIIRTVQIAAGEEPITQVLVFGAEGEYADLTDRLEKEGLAPETVDPFVLPGVTAKPEVKGRSALLTPLVGALLAEREKKSRPILDFLHPRQMPKPPNYALPFVLFLLILAGVFAYLWHWNKKDLLRRNNEVAQLTQTLSGVQAEYGQLQPQYAVLDAALGWDRAGVNVLDTLRDILLRLPPAPDMLISRMAYNQYDPMYNSPVFILSAKITEPQVYNRFLREMTSDNAYRVNSRGPLQTPSATDDETERVSEYNFTAVILCARRAPRDYLGRLPDDLREVSNQRPEFYGQRIDQTPPAAAPAPSADDESSENEEAAQ